MTLKNILIGTGIGIIVFFAGYFSRKIISESKKPETIEEFKEAIDKKEEEIKEIDEKIEEVEKEKNCDCTSFEECYKNKCMCSCHKSKEKCLCNEGITTGKEFDCNCPIHKNSEEAK